MSTDTRSIWTRPIFHLRPHPDRTARRLVEESELPAPIRSWILEVTGRSGLWRSERAEVARELIAHAHDALDHGRDPDEALRSMGDPRTLATLVRRSMKRKRPWIWKRLRDLRRAVGAVIVLMLVFYATLAARFYLSSPSITTDYLAQFNEHRIRFDESDYAWPIYQDAAREWAPIYKAERDLQDGRASAARNADDVYTRFEIDERYWAGIDDPNRMTTGHPDYERTVAIYKSFRPQLDRIIEATSLPLLGVLYASEYETIEHPDGTTETRSIPPSNDPSENDPLFNVLLPHLGSMRQLTNHLAFDARIAVREGDADRAHRDLLAMLRLTRQLQNEPGFVISDLVGVAMIDAWCSTLLGFIEANPDVFSRAQLVELAHALSDVSSRVTMSYDNEQLMFHDFLQRVYTDNGSGNGHLTAEGMKMLELAGNIYDFEDFNPDQNLRAILNPAAMAIIPDRKSARTRYDTYIETYKSVLREGPGSFWKIIHADRQISIDARDALVLDPVDIMIPALGKATARVFHARAETGAVMLAIALEIDRMDHGDYPESLDELVPDRIPSLPEDPMNPGHPVLYKRTDTGYVIYSTGSDADDDDAARAPDRSDEQRNAMSFERRFGHEPIEIIRSAPDPSTGSERPPPYPRTDAPDLDWILLEMDRSESAG